MHYMHTHTNINIHTHTYMYILYTYIHTYIHTHTHIHSVYIYTIYYMNGIRHTMTQQVFLASCPKLPVAGFLGPILHSETSTVSAARATPKNVRLLLAVRLWCCGDFVHQRSWHRFTRWLFNINMERSTIFKNGKPSISMGHLYHGYVSHNQMASLKHLKTMGLPIVKPPWRKGEFMTSRESRSIGVGVYTEHFSGYLKVDLIFSKIHTATLRNIANKV